MSIVATSYPGTVSTTELIDTKVKDMFLSIDTQYNKVMLNALTHGEEIRLHMRVHGILANWPFVEGIHTGIVAVTLWTACPYFSLLPMFTYLTGTSSFKA